MRHTTTNAHAEPRAESRSLLAKILTAEGYEVRVADGGELALASARDLLGDGIKGAKPSCQKALW